MKALITGITGQDGSYLAEMLLEKGYEVCGIIRRASNFNTQRIDHIFNKLDLRYGDMSEMSSLVSVIADFKPDEIYNLAAQSHVKTSFDVPVYSCQSNGIGVLNLLESIRIVNKDIRMYQASTSEMFGDSPAKQSETTEFRPRSPYACSKVFAHHLCGNYREAYGLHVSCGILFNHESPRRGETFVSRKITKAVARIALGKQKELHLGNIEAKRDWGYAPEYVQAMFSMIRKDKPDDYVIASGQSNTVVDFLERVFLLANLNWRDHVVIDEKYFRPTEVEDLCGDSSKAKEKLGWQAFVKFDELCEIMYRSDYDQENR